MIFCGRIIGALSSDWLLPLPPIRQQHNHDQLSQHNFKTQELSTKYSPKTQTQQHNQYQLSQHNFTRRYLLSTGLSTAVRGYWSFISFYLQVLSPQGRVKHWQQNINKTDDFDNKAFPFLQLVPLPVRKWPENFPRCPSTPPTPSRLLLPGCSPPLCSPAGLLDGKGWGDLLPSLWWWRRPLGKGAVMLTPPCLEISL